jgi:CMP-N-acetylneuraminic acid synthetase
MKLGNVIAHIPARGGSKRVPSKNLRIMDGKPMIAYAAQAALACKKLGEVYINTDSDVLAQLGISLGCKTYKRPEELATDTASGDDFTYDFINAMNPDTLVMISPVCPLIETQDILEALQAYEASDADTLITCSKTQMQTFVEDKPVNIKVDGPLAASQDNPAIITCNWAVTIWNADTFKRLYEKNKSGYFGDNRLLWPIEPLKAVKVSEEKDFKLAEALLVAKRNEGNISTVAEYWKPL